MQLRAGWNLTKVSRGCGWISSFTAVCFGEREKKKLKDCYWRIFNMGFCHVVHHCTPCTVTVRHDSQIFPKIRGPRTIAQDIVRALGFLLSLSYTPLNPCLVESVAYVPQYSFLTTQIIQHRQSFYQLVVARSVCVLLALSVGISLSRK